MDDDGPGGSRESPLSPDRARGILDSMIDDLPGVVYRCRNDADWTMLGLTPNVEELTGYKAEELIDNARVAFADLIHPDDREQVREGVGKAVEEDRSFRIGYRIRTRSGEERWILEQGRAVREDGEGILAGYIQDVTGPVVRRVAHVQDELEATRRQSGHLALLQDVTAIVNDERELESALRAVLPSICEALDFDVGHVVVQADDDSRTLVSWGVWHLSDEVDGLDAFRRATDSRGWSADRGLPGRVLASGSAEWVEDVETAADFHRISGVDESPVRAGVAAPVRSGDRTLAVLEFYGVESRSRDPEVERLLEQIGVQLGRVWEREEAAREQRAGARRFRQLAENIDAGFWLSTPEGDPLYVSSGFEALTGFDGTTDDWREYLEVVHPDDRERVEALFSDRDRAPYEIEYRIGRPDGEVRWLRQRAFPIHDGEGELHRIGGLADDITEPRRARARLERILDSLDEGLVILDQSGRITYANDAATRLTPYGRPELVDRSYAASEWEITHPDGRPMDPEDLPAARALSDGEAIRNERIVVHDFDDGRPRVISVNAVPYVPDDGEVEEVIVSFADVTDQERYARELRESEARFRQIAEHIDTVFWISSPDKGEMEYVSPAYADIWGRKPEELQERPQRWLEHIHHDDRERVQEALPRQPGGDYEEEYRVVRPDGEIRWVWDRAVPIRDDDGRVYRLIGIAEDITERKEAEQELRRTEEHFRALIESSADVIAVLDEDLVTRYVSPSVRDVLGYHPREITDTTGSVRIHPEDREEAMADLRALRERPGEILVQAHRMIARDGSTRYVEATARNLLDEPAVEGIVVNLRDVTPRRELQAQLRQAQKMEAVGRLAGGIAHDFNNLLTVIRSESDLLLMDLEEGGGLAEDVKVIRDASDRAARLTSQLLAFSREQVLRPKVVDLNEVLKGMKSLFARLLGDDIAVETDLDRELPPVRVDPGQLEQVVMNLAVNARDAMPDGGVLDLSTEVEELTSEEAGAIPGVESGPHVRLSVTDTGTGMDEETLARIFEPFFSTKEGEEGTGLGLAVSYGIVKQSGGTIHVESEPGAGATFDVRFPPAEGPPEPLDRPASEDSEEEVPSARVLVVEDDPHVRRVTRRILARAGFDVSTVAEAEAAVELLEQGNVEPDLVLTDLVLPGMGGRELVDGIRERFSGIRVVAMSGYAEGSPGSRGDLPDEVAFVQKPFTPQGLVDVVREQLLRR